MSTNKDSFFYFSHFDPLKGELPDYTCSKARAKVEEARYILRNRSNKEIYSGAEIISWLSQHEVVSEHNWSELLKDAKALDNGEDYERDNIGSSCYDAKNLLTGMVTLDISEYDEFKNATWPELFAIIALGKFADACENTNYRNQFYDKDTNKILAYGYFGNASVDATECLCIAKNIMNQDKIRSEIEDDISNNIKKKQSLHGKEGSIKRHAKVNQLKRDCFEYFRSVKENKVSKRQAAHDFFESLPHERKYLLAPTNAVRTLAEGITYFEKRYSIE